MRALALCALLLAGSAQAFCWQQAGERYRIDPRLLWAIAKVESGLNNGAVNRNSDGSHDIGLMQINSRNFAKLASYGYTEAVLRENACASVMAGAWILSGMVERYGYNWRAVGAYNAGTASNRQKARARYAQKIWQVYRQQLKQG